MKTKLLAIWLLLATACAVCPPVQATVSTTAPRNDYIGNGATATYSYTFKIFAATDLRVTTRTEAGVETTLVYPTDYTVTGVGNKTGGTITLTAGVLTSDYALTIRFDRTPRQSTDLRNQGSFFAETHEEKFDELTRYSQQLKDVVDRSMHLPETEAGTPAATTLPLAADRAGNYLAFDASGNPVMTATGISSAVVSTYAETLLDDTTAGAARQTLLLDKHGADLASAGTINLDTTTGDLIDVTGTTTITAITLSEGVEKTVRFTGALTLTNGASLVLPGSVNITTAAGDFAVFRGYASSVVRLVSYQRVGSEIPANLGSVGSSPRVSSAGSATYGAPAGYLWGLTLSNNGSDATNDIDIALGEAASRSTTYSSRVILALTAGITKRLDATWATGTNQGGRSSSVVLSNTTYHICVIRVAGVDDVGFDTSETCSNLITDHSATHVRRIGSILRESAAIVAFSQEAHEFLRKASVLSYDAANPGTSAVTVTLGVPVGIPVLALCRAQAHSTSVTTGVILFSALDENDQAPSLTAAPLSSGVSYNVGGADWPQPITVRTNASAQIRARLSFSDANVTVKIAPYGWIDTRGTLN